MVAFCTYCWAEINSTDDHCSACGKDFCVDTRSYEEKLIDALAHPLPEARARICWLLAENKIHSAVPDLIRVAERDPDLFVQKAAIEGLATIQDARAYLFLRMVSNRESHLLREVARRGLDKFDSSPEC